MVLTTTAVLVAISAIFVIGIVKVFRPLFKERSRGKKTLDGIDGIKPHWLLGHMREFQPTAESFKFTTTLIKDFPKLGKLWIGPFVWYLGLHHPHVLPAILNTAEPKDFLGYGFLKDWIGDGLLISSGKKWQRNRRLLTKAFHFDILKEYHATFNKSAEEMLNKWCKTGQGKRIEIFNDVTLMTLDSLLQCIMSCETHCQTKKIGVVKLTPYTFLCSQVHFKHSGDGNAYVNAVFALSQIVVKRMFNPLIHSNFIFYLTPIGRKFKAHCDYVHQFDEKMIKERKSMIKSIMEKCDQGSQTNGVMDIEQYQTCSRKRLDFLDILLLTRDEDGKGLSDREIRDEVDTFLFEGHDTTASGISWAFYCLAKYPEHQEKCREEILNAIGHKDNIQGSDLSTLTHMSLFLKEVMRLYPPVFFIARNTTKPINFPRGFGEDQACLDETPPSNSSRVVDASTNISISTYTLHRNHTVWEDPEVFDPLRFTPENIKTRSSFAYLPFSAGPRNCIGKNFAMSEIKITICKALQRFRFYIDDDCPEPVILPSVTLKAKDGIYLKMAPL